MSTNARTLPVAALEIDWALYATVAGLTLVSTALGYPYVAELGGTAYSAADLGRMVALNGLPSLVAVFVGLLCSRALGLGAPLLEAAIHGRLGEIEGRDRLVRRSLIVAPAAGLAVSAIVIPMDLVFVAARLGSGVDGAIRATIAAREAGSPGPLASVSAIFYGGVFEEVNLRFFVMSLWAWVVAFVVSRVRGERIRPYPAVMTAAVIVAAVAFGAGHLFTAASLGELDALAVVRTISLNAVPGVLFGFLFWKVGLEAAMLAHLAADVGLHVLFPLFLGVWT